MGPASGSVMPQLREVLSGKRNKRQRGIGNCKIAWLFNFITKQAEATQSNANASILIGSLAGHTESIPSKSLISGIIEKRGENI